MQHGATNLLSTSTLADERDSARGSSDAKLGVLGWFGLVD